MKSILTCLIAFSMVCISVSADNEKQATEKEEKFDFNPTRTWTSADGTSSFKGKVTKYDGEKVTISRVGRNSNTVPKEQFSEEDITWLEENKEFIGLSGRELASLIEARNISKVGRALLKMKQINEVPVKKNAKYYILLSSASWCPPCRKEAPGIVKLYDNEISKSSDIELVLLSCDNTEEAAAKWAEDVGMKYPIFFDKGKYQNIPGAKGNLGNGIPHATIIDREGNLITHDYAGTIMRNYKALCQ